MNALVDTHLLIWWFMDARELSALARGILEEPSNRIVASAASLWELVIKVSSGRMALRLDDFAGALARDGFDLLPVLPAHALAVAALPRHHADPFDRMLIAQARCEKLSLLTADRALCAYGDPVRLV